MRARGFMLPLAAFAAILAACSWDLSEYSKGSPDAGDDDDSAADGGSSSGKGTSSGKMSSSSSSGAGTSSTTSSSSSAGGTSSSSGDPSKCPDVPAGAGDCPLACSGGCAGGICHIDCGYESCNGSTFNCPSDRPCEITCADEACNGSKFVCPEKAPCSIKCATEDACSGTTVTCGQGACSGACHFDGFGEMTAKCNDACTCSFNGCTPP